MEYKVIAIGGHEIARLADMLNDNARIGYHAVYFFETNGRVIVVMENNNDASMPYEWQVGQPIVVKTPVEEKKKPGRPAGSKNKPKGE